MRNTPLRKTVALAVSIGLLIAAVSGGAVTYASFTDSGNVDVTFTAGNISDSPEITASGANGGGSDEPADTEGNESETSGSENTTTESETNGTENTTTEREINGTENTTTESETNGTENTSETSQDVSEQISGEGIPTTDALNVHRTSDVIPAAATAAVENRRLPAGPLS